MFLLVINEKRNNMKNNQIKFLILSFAVWGVFWGGWGILLPAIKLKVGATDAMLGWALVGITVGAIPAMLGTGLIVKKFTKWALFSVLLFFAGAIAAITLVKTPVELAIVLFFVGASSGMLDVIMNSGVATFESITGKHYFNYAHAAFPIAVIVTSPTVGFSRQLGVDTNIILLLMAGIVTIVGFLSLKINVNHNQEKEEVKGKQNNKKIIVTRAILFFGFIGLLVHLMENAVEQWSAIYLEDKLLSPPAIASFGLTGYMGMLFLGRIIAQKFNEFWSEKVILTLSAGTTVLGFLIVALLKNPIFVITGYSISGLGISPIVPMIFSLTGRSVSQDNKVKAISTVTIIAYTGYLISPPLIGYISSISNLRTAWVFLTGVALVMLALINFLFLKTSSNKNITDKASV